MTEIWFRSKVGDVSRVPDYYRRDAYARGNLWTAWVGPWDRRSPAELERDHPDFHWRAVEVEQSVTERLE